jgi:hypothetical protein
MKVRVKQGKSGFIYGSMRKEGSEFTLKPVGHSTVIVDGSPATISIEEQFSDNWMEKIEKPKAKPGPKPKGETED